MSVDRTPGITSIKAHPDRIAVHWQDGQTGTYHHIWLRDNCMCEQCGDRSGGHRYLEIGQIDPAVHPRDSRINHRGNVEIH